MYASDIIPPVTATFVYESVFVSNSISTTSGINEGLNRPFFSSIAILYSRSSVLPKAWLTNGSTKKPFWNLASPLSSETVV